MITLIYAKNEPKRSKNEVLGTFSEFRWLDLSDIANSDGYNRYFEDEVDKKS